MCFLVCSTCFSVLALAVAGFFSTAALSTLPFTTGAAAAFLAAFGAMIDVPSCFRESQSLRL